MDKTIKEYVEMSKSLYSFRIDMFDPFEILLRVGMLETVELSQWKDIWED